MYISGKRLWHHFGDTNLNNDQLKKGFSLVKCNTCISKKIKRHYNYYSMYIKALYKQILSACYKQLLIKYYGNAVVLCSLKELIVHSYFKHKYIYV